MAQPGRRGEGVGEGGPLPRRVALLAALAEQMTGAAAAGDMAAARLAFEMIGRWLVEERDAQDQLGPMPLQVGVVREHPRVGAGAQNHRCTAARDIARDRLGISDVPATGTRGAVITAGGSSVSRAASVASPSAIRTTNARLRGLRFRRRGPRPRAPAQPALVRARQVKPGYPRVTPHRMVLAAKLTRQCMHLRQAALLGQRQRLVVKELSLLVAPLRRSC